MKNKRLLKKGSLLKADIYLVESGSSKLLLKTFEEKPFWVKWTYGWFVIRHESRILKKLQRIPSVPQLVSRNRFSLSETFIEGFNLSQLKLNHQKPPLAVFEQIREIIRRMHDEGVYHLDLRLSSNYIYSPSNQKVFIIDFNTAFSPPSFLLKLLPFLKKLLEEIDHCGLIKMKYEFYPEELTEEEKKRYRRLNRFRRFWIFTPEGRRSRHLDDVSH